MPRADHQRGVKIAAAHAIADVVTPDA